MEAPGRGHEDRSSCADLPECTLSRTTVSLERGNDEEIRWSGPRDLCR